MKIYNSNAISSGWRGNIEYSKMFLGTLDFESINMCWNFFCVTFRLCDDSRPFFGCLVKIPFYLFSAVLVSLWHESTHSHIRISFLINIYSAQHCLWSYFHGTRRILKWKNFVWLVEKINGQWTDAAARK